MWPCYRLTHFAKSLRLEYNRLHCFLIRNLLALLQGRGVHPAADGRNIFGAQVLPLGGPPTAERMPCATGKGRNISQRFRVTKPIAGHPYSDGPCRMVRGGE